MYGTGEAYRGVVGRGAGLSAPPFVPVAKLAGANLVTGKIPRRQALPLSFHRFNKICLALWLYVMLAISLDKPDGIGFIQQMSRWSLLQHS